MRYASSAYRTWMAPASASEYTAAVAMPSSRHARMTRIAISPRLAIRIFLKSRFIFFYLERATRLGPPRAVARESQRKGLSLLSVSLQDRRELLFAVLGRHFLKSAADRLEDRHRELLAVESLECQVDVLQHVLQRKGERLVGAAQETGAAHIQVRDMSLREREGLFP